MRVRRVMTVRTSPWVGKAVYSLDTYHRKESPTLWRLTVTGKNVLRSLILRRNLSRYASINL